MDVSSLSHAAPAERTPSAASVLASLPEKQSPQVPQRTQSALPQLQGAKTPQAPKRTISETKLNATAPEFVPGSGPLLHTPGSNVRKEKPQRSKSYNTSHGGKQKNYNGRQQQAPSPVPVTPPPTAFPGQVPLHDLQNAAFFQSMSTLLPSSSTPIFPNPVLSQLAMQLSVANQMAAANHMASTNQMAGLNPILTNESLNLLAAAIQQSTAAGFMQPSVLGGIGVSSPAATIAAGATPNSGGSGQKRSASKKNRKSDGKESPKAIREVKTPPDTQQSEIQPTEEEIAALQEKILKQVEFYFSDQNIVTDNFMQKLIKKDPEGYVPISVLANFRKVKMLIPKNWNPEAHLELVTETIKSSSQLVLSEDFERVRRSSPIPEVDMQEIQERTVVVENLPTNPSIEYMEELFSKAGRVRMVRICQPQSANSANSRGKFVITNKRHALVEFESVEEAEKAAKELNDASDWRNGLRVRLMAKKGSSQGSNQNKGNQQKARPSEEGGTPSLALVPESSRKGGKGAEGKGGISAAFSVDHQAYGSSPRDHSEPPKKKKNQKKAAPSSANDSTTQDIPSTSKLPSGTPPKFSFSTSPLSRSPLGRAEGIKPFPGPKMPDGTRGFTMGRGKKLPEVIPGKQTSLA